MRAMKSELLREHNRYCRLVEKGLEKVEKFIIEHARLWAAMP